MAKLVSVNMESDKHFDRVTALLQSEQPDIVCLQEAPDTYLPTLVTLGYHTAFAPMYRDDRFFMGIIIASTMPFESHTYYYYRAQPTIIEYNPLDKPGTISHPYIFASFTFDKSTYRVATTHVMWTPDGSADHHQRAGIAAMLEALAREPSHVLCGDFNIPRGYNELYPSLISHYTDAIPFSYPSSLDPVLHRLAHTDTDQPIFETFMVDYLFTQPPYNATNVRLQFGVSDHAAIIAELRDAHS